MKLNHGTVLLMLLLTISLLASHSSARLFNLKADHPSKVASHEENIISTFMDQAAVDFSNLMGEDRIEDEECAERDAECMKRRMTAEAHLDYIYTQRHKPKP